MTTENIFPTDQAGSTEGDNTPSTPQAPTIPTELQELVGEGKKYSTLDAAYKSIPHAQTHISTLEADLLAIKAEKESLGAELAKRKTAEELLADIQKSTATTQPTSNGVEANPQVISEIVQNELAKQSNQLQQEAFKVQQEAHKATVVDAFRSKYGEAKAQEAYEALAKDNSMTVGDLNNLALSSPQAVLQLAGFNSKPATPGSINSSVNTQALASTSHSSDNTSAIRLGNRSTSKDLASSWAAARAKVHKDLGIK